MKLPKGYYAVQSDFENAPKGVFSFRGVSYEVEDGVNLFGTILEAEAAVMADGEVAPSEVPKGLPYEAFSHPVLLFSVGEHRIDGYEFGGSRYLLGEGVGVSPNLPAPRGELPPFAPARAAESAESVFYGGQSRGVLTARSEAAECVVIDGVTFKKTRFFDYRVAGNCDFKLYLRNIVYIGVSNHIMNYFAAPRKDSDIRREVHYEDCRIEHYDDMLQGGVFLYANAQLTVLERFCCNGTTQVFGFTDIAATRSNCVPNADVTEILIRDSHFRDLAGDHGISTCCRNAGERAVNLTVENTDFVNASRAGEAPLRPQLINARCALRVRGCRFVDTRGDNATAILVRGKGENIEVEDCSFEGFLRSWERAPALPESIPAYVEGRAENWQTSCEDAHTVIGTARADYAVLDALYAGRSVAYGDQHCHTACGGRSDGKFPLAEWPAKMQELSLDFAAIVDHHQMRGFFLPEWDKTRFIYGTEPGSHLLDSGGEMKKDSFHYNMLFPHEYGLAMVLANFPEFEFHGDELTGSFGYPTFTRERIAELNAYIRSIGGVLVHAHPMALMGSTEPLDYYFGEYSHLEVMVAAYHGHRSFKSYDLWVKILNAGKRMYAAGGSDTHRDVTNGCVSTVYAAEKNAASYFAQIYAGNYVAGAVGIQMCIDNTPMGGALAWRDGQVLRLRVGDFFAPVWRDNTCYELRVYTDKGLAYASIFDGKEPQQLSLAVKDRAYYRAEIFDLTHGYRIAVGNPIWLEHEPQDAAT